jgi:hypothetical protein
MGGVIEPRYLIKFLAMSRSGEERDYWGRCFRFENDFIELKNGIFAFFHV